jgi:hypothetical protein
MEVLSSWLLGCYSPSCHEFKDSIAVLSGISHSQPFTNRIFCCLIIVRSAVSHVTHQFYKIRSFTRLALTFVLDVLTDRCDHYGRPFDHFRNDLLCYYHTPLSNDWEFLFLKKHILLKKTHHSKIFFVRTTFHSRSHCTSTYPQPLTFESYGTCNPHQCCLVSQLHLFNCLVQPPLWWKDFHSRYQSKEEIIWKL